MNTSETLRAPGNDPLPALEGVAKALYERGDLCGSACVEAAAEELERLRAMAFDPVNGQAAVVLTVDEEWGHSDHCCRTCFGWEPGHIPEDARPQHDHEGHWPSCVRGAIVARAVETPEARAARVTAARIRATIEELVRLAWGGWRTVDWSEEMVDGVSRAPGFVDAGLAGIVKTLRVGAAVRSAGVEWTYARFMPVEVAQDIAAVASTRLQLLQGILVRALIEAAGETKVVVPTTGEIRHLFDGVREGVIAPGTVAERIRARAARLDALQPEHARKEGDA